MVIISYLATGEMVEWSITAVLKTAVPRGTGGSNPSLSANKGVNQQVMRFTPFSTPKNLRATPPKTAILGGANHLLSLHREGYISPPTPLNFSMKATIFWKTLCFLLKY